MYLAYIDESGDTGLNNSPTQYFVLTAIVINENDWRQTLTDFVEFRRYLNKSFGLPLRTEIHTSDFVNQSPNLKTPIEKNIRIDILKKCLKWLNLRTELSIITIRCKKNRANDKDVFEYTWATLIQRIENTLMYKNFPKQEGIENSILIADNTDKNKLKKLLRKMRHINFIPSMGELQPKYGSRNIAIKHIIEDPIFKDSSDSYFHQLADIVAYFARQYYEPNRTVRKKGLRTFYTTFLKDVTNKHATYAKTPNKIVEI